MQFTQFSLSLAACHFVASDDKRSSSAPPRRNSVKIVIHTNSGVRGKDPRVPGTRESGRQDRARQLPSSIAPERQRSAQSGSSSPGGAGRAPARRNRLSRVRFSSWSKPEATPILCGGFDWVVCARTQSCIGRWRRMCAGPQRARPLRKDPAMWPATDGASSPRHELSAPL